MDERTFSAELRRLRLQRGLSLRGLGELAHRAKSHLHELETARKSPTAEVAEHLDRVLHAGGRLAELGPAPAPAAATADDELALDLVRRVQASDVSAETLDRLEAIADELAIAYPTNPPAELLDRVRRHLVYVGDLFDARMTLRQRQRLVVAGGWLSLLAATLQIDLRARSTAARSLATAGSLAGEAGHDELRAWCVETRAWAELTAGRHRQALALSQRAQLIAPAGSSAHIQATAQEGRAWARLRDQRQTALVLGRLERLTSPLPIPDQPEHHYRYDPAKAQSYTATTLAWAGDPGAELYARAVVDDLAASHRRRRSELARLDLALALVDREPDEAAALATRVVGSGWLVPSNRWRVAEVLARVEAAGASAVDLRDSFEAHRRG